MLNRALLTRSGLAERGITNIWFNCENLHTRAPQSILCQPYREDTSALSTIGNAPTCSILTPAMVCAHRDIPPTLVASCSFRPSASIRMRPYLLKCPRQLAELVTTHTSQHSDQIRRWYAWELVRSVSHYPTVPLRNLWEPHHELALFYSAITYMVNGKQVNMSKGSETRSANSHMNRARSPSEVTIKTKALIFLQE